jgi:hypothetical protein
MRLIFYEFIYLLMKRASLYSQLFVIISEKSSRKADRHILAFCAMVEQLSQIRSSCSWIISNYYQHKIELFLI